MESISAGALSVSIRCLQCKQEYRLESALEARCSQCGKPGWLRMQSVSDAIILDVLPNVDLEAIDLVSLGRALECGEAAPHLVLNLRFLKFVSSSFIAGLFALQKSLRGANGHLVVSGANPVIREIFEVMKLDPYFDFGDSVASTDSPAPPVAQSS